MCQNFSKFERASVGNWQFSIKNATNKLFLGISTNFYKHLDFLVELRWFVWILARRIEKVCLYHKKHKICANLPNWLQTCPNFSKFAPDSRKFSHISLLRYFDQSSSNLTKNKQIWTNLMMVKFAQSISRLKLNQKF